MPILNYTTKISPEKTVAEIQGRQTFTMTNEEIKKVAKAYKAFARSKRTAILANMTASPQTYDQLTGNLAPGNYRGALMDFIKAGLVQLCDKAATQKGFGELLTYAATPLLDICREMKAAELPALSEAQTAMLVEMTREGIFTVSEIAERAEISKTTAQHYVAAFLRDGFVTRKQGAFKVGEPVFFYEIRGGEGWGMAWRLLNILSSVEKRENVLEISEELG